MYNTANKIVGSAKDIKGLFSTYKEYRDYEFASFCLDRKSLNYTEIMDIWTKWITAYCAFRKLDNPAGATIEEDPDLIVLWLRKPCIEPEGCGSTHEEVKKCPDELWDKVRPIEKPDLENPSFVRVKAYLCILRVDYYTTIREHQIAVRVSPDK